MQSFLKQWAEQAGVELCVSRLDNGSVEFEIFVSGNVAAKATLAGFRAKRIPEFLNYGEDEIVANLRTLVERLVRHIPDESTTKKQALDYLKRIGLQSSILREEPPCRDV